MYKAHANTGTQPKPVRGAYAPAQHSHNAAHGPHCVVVSNSQLLRTFGTGSATPKVDGKHTKLPERFGKTSHTEPTPYHTVAVVFAGMVQVP